MKVSNYKALGGLTTAMMLIVLFLGFGCKKQDVVYNTNTDVNITGYLDKNPDQFSQFKKILDLTGNSGYLNAYGAYTLFLPTNDGVNAYLKTIGKSSVEAVDLQTLKDLVKFHLLADTLSSASFKDGKLPTLTMYGQYLITGASNSNGTTKIIVNKQASVVKADVKVGNGLIHVVDNMLVPAAKSLAQLIESNPKYSIFTQALKETGLYDSLNILPANNPDKNKAWLTVIAETDSSIKAAGFSTYAALKARYSTTGNPKNVADSLHLYMDYHILPGAKYMADIISTGSHETFAPAEIITSKLNGTLVAINDDDFNGVHETGTGLNRSGSDNSATNGVLHQSAPYTAGSVTTTGHYTIKVRKPVTVNWDVADFPELRNLPAYFRKASYTFSRNQLPAGITGSGTSDMYYTYSASEVTWWRDYINFPLGPTARNAWWELTTPMLIKGKYKVWLCYERYQKSTSNKSVNNQISIDGTVMQRTWDEILFRPTGTDAELEAQGWKQYTAGSTNTKYAGRLLGTIDIKSTDRHKIRFTWVGGSSGDCWLDLIQFIPADQTEQVYPRFNADGTLQGR